MESNASVKAGEGRKLPKPNNIVTVPTSPGLEFFKWWCTFLRPFVKLTNREITVMSSFLKQRWELSKHISDPIILDEMLMSEKTKLAVQKECGITSQHLYVVMNTLRNKKVLLNNTINPRLVPNMRDEDKGVFQLLVLFKDTGEKHE